MRGVDGHLMDNGRCSCGYDPTPGAPFVNDWGAHVAASALRDAAAAWQEGGWADDLPPAGRSRPQLILGMAQRAVAYFRARADQIERGEP